MSYGEYVAENLRPAPRWAGRAVVGAESSAADAGAFRSRLCELCEASTMDGANLKPASLSQDRVGCRCGECSVEVWGVQDVDTSNHLT